MVSCIEIILHYYTYCIIAAEICIYTKFFSEYSKNVY